MPWLIIICCLVVFFGFMVFFGAPYVPSKRKEVRQALSRLYPLGPDDTLVDLGCGDGVVLRIARKRGAQAFGYEINPLLVLIAKRLSHGDTGTTVKLGNFWKAHFPPATTVVYVFGDGRDIKKMYAKARAEATRLHRPLAFISYGFDVPGLEPEKTIGAHHLYTAKPLQRKT